MENPLTTYQSTFSKWQSSLPWQKISEDADHITYTHKKDTLTIFQHPHSINFPLPPKWQFKNAFNAVFYNDFFDRIYLDDKVKRIFKDSVAVDTVIRKNQFNGSLMFDCDPCNVVGQLQFKGSKFYYPATLGTTIEETIHRYLFDIIDEETYVFTAADHMGKIVSSNTGKSGILIRSKSMKWDLVKDIVYSFMLKEN